MLCVAISAPSIAVTNVAVLECARLSGTLRVRAGLLETLFVIRTPLDLINFLLSPYQFLIKFLFPTS